MSTYPTSSWTETSLRAEVFSDLASFEDLRTEWPDLFRRSACENPFLSFEWLHEWWVRFGRGKRLFLIAVRAWTGKLVGVAPFYRRRVAGVLYSLEFLGSRWVGSDHLTVLADVSQRQNVLQEVVRVIVAHRNDWDYVELADCDEESDTIGPFRTLLRESGFVEHIICRGSCPYATLPSSFATYLASLNSHWRRNYRRSIRLLTAAGRLELVATEDPRLIADRYREAMELHRRRFADRQESSVILPQAIQKFHESALLVMAERGWARLYLLQMDGKTIAACHGFALGSKYIALQSGFDPDWSRESAGSVLIGMAIEDCIRRGQTEFDFLRGAERYKSHWSQQTRASITVRLCDGALPNGIAYASLISRELARRARRSVEPVIAAIKKGPVQ